MRNFSCAADNNKGPILEALREPLRDVESVFEVGSGSGQHALHFAAHFRHLTWQPAELEDAVAALAANVAAAGLANVCAPVTMDVRDDPWPCAPVDCVFTANTLHILSWPLVREFARGVGQVLEPDGLLFVYGPLRYGGEFTTPSNARFDAWLRQRDPASGIRDFEAVDGLLAATGLRLQADVAMPANNRLVIWRRTDRE